jgi:hypothetical protein
MRFCAAEIMIPAAPSAQNQNRGRFEKISVPGIAVPDTHEYMPDFESL